MNTQSLFKRLLKAGAFKTDKKKCIYPTPYNGDDSILAFLYCRTSHCEVFFACSQENFDKWVDAVCDYEFYLFIEQEVMTFCEENTDWNCNGCQSSVCCCKPFGNGDYKYGIIDEENYEQ